MGFSAKRIIERLFLEHGLGKFDTLEVIDTGPMSDLHKARNKHTGDIVCLKLYNRDGQVMRQAIERKHPGIRKTLLRIRHPYVLHIFEIGSCKRRMYNVSQFVNGVTLGSMVKSVGRTFTWWLGIFKQIITGTRYLHEEAQVVHRDLNPFNVMLTPANTIKIIDLDFAFPIQTQATGLFRRSGTLGYMAPEQAVGDVLDERLDVYSFGATMYETLAKKNPFRDTTGEDIKTREERTRLAHLRYTPPPPSKVNPDVPEEFDHIVMRCLTPRRNERYENFALVADAIARFEQRAGLAPEPLDDFKRPETLL